MNSNYTIMEVLATPRHCFVWITHSISVSAGDTITLRYEMAGSLIKARISALCRSTAVGIVKRF